MARNGQGIEILSDGKAALAAKTFFGNWFSARCSRFWKPR
jgi:hypothetical protein